MARKLYIFGIGGTGSRVIKAVTLLFASGLKLENNFDTVIPIIIDPDTANGDLNRTKDILKLYQEIRNQVDQPDDFFSQEIKTINEIADTGTTINPDHFLFKLDDTKKKFKEYIGFNSLSEQINEADDKNFLRLLYSEKNLDSDLDVGFKGNPNMGAVVLNQFTNSVNFKKFAETYHQNDAIFIINSIFGGTGAAGFPLLLKNLRNNTNITNASIINTTKIGGITYLPYFSLDDRGNVDADSFMEKAKTALEYYNRTIIGQNQINTMYFLGNDGNTNFEKYAEGKEEQKNKAHFLEMAGALAVLDFCKNINNLDNTTTVKEFGIENDTQTIIFNDLNLANNEQLSTPLTKYKLFTEYLNKGLGRALNVSRWTISNIRLVGKNQQSLTDKNYFKSAEYETQIKKFNDYFEEWLIEMKENKPAFSPFNEITSNNAFEIVKNKSPKGNKSFKELDIQNSCLLADDVSIRSNDKKHTMLIKMFGKSLDKALQKKNIIKE